MGAWSDLCEGGRGRPPFFFFIGSIATFEKEKPSTCKVARLEERSSAISCMAEQNLRSIGSIATFAKLILEGHKKRKVDRNVLLTFLEYKNFLIEIL